MITEENGGEVIIMNKTDYDDKMFDSLSDETTYEKHVDYTEKEAEKFNREVRKVPMRKNRGKKLLNLLGHPRPPRMRGHPEVHKPGVQMRRSTSSIGSAPQIT